MLRTKPPSIRNAAPLIADDSGLLRKVSKQRINGFPVRFQ